MPLIADRDGVTKAYPRSIERHTPLASVVATSLTSGAVRVVPRRSSRCYNCAVARVPTAHLGGPVNQRAASGRSCPARGEVELWWADTHKVGDPAEAVEVLDAAERARASRFHFEHDRARYVRRHAFVRQVLASYLHVTPEDVEIHRSPAGRPVLGASTGLSFNTSTADDLVVVAVTRGGRVGVDIERLRDLDDAMDIAQAFFTVREVARLEALPPASRSRAFLDLWTRKESLTKAVGEGLRVPLDKLDASERHRDGAWRPVGPLGRLPYVIRALDGPPGYTGAVTLSGTSMAARDMGATVR